MSKQGKIIDIIYLQGGIKEKDFCLTADFNDLLIQTITG